MDESQREPNESSQAGKGSSPSRSELEAAIGRLERALQYEEGAPEDHARCRAAMSDMAAAELEGRRVAQLFPAAYAHLDACESCALEYADLIDTLLGLERGDFAAAETAPPLPPKLLLAVRIRGWVGRTAKQVLEQARAGTDEIESFLDMLIERLRDLPSTPSPVQVRQMAMGFGGEDEETPLVLATWFAAQQIATQYTSQDLQAMVAAGTHGKQARSVAEATARQIQLGRRQQNAFVEQFVRSAETDPEEFVRLGRQTGS